MMNPPIVQAEVTDRQQRLHAEAAAYRRVRVSRASAPGACFPMALCKPMTLRSRRGQT
jgi:hypothetical protein